MADSKGLVYARTDSGNQVDTCSESVLIALRIIDRLTAKPMLLPDDQQHLRTLWLLIELQAYPTVSLAKVTDLAKLGRASDPAYANPSIYETNQSPTERSK